jgi:uncharacterized protein YjiS (DUF1127 family)
MQIDKVVLSITPAAISSKYFLASTGEWEPAMSVMNLNISAVGVRRLPRWSGLRALVNEWRERARSRGELRMLDDRELWDAGLTRMDADNECDKAFWQP